MLSTALTSSDMDSPDVRQDMERILSARKRPFREQDIELIQRAYLCARELHKGVMRLSGEPYICHPVTVAGTLAELQFDAHAVAAGLLHDILEDTHVTYEQLLEAFPKPVVDLVEGVTKISSLDFRTNREKQVASLRKMMLAMTSDIRVIVIKICDRLHNMRTLQYLKQKKQQAISQDTLEIYAPLAERLGMDRIKSELEDLATRYLYPVEYAEIVEYLEVHEKERDELIERFQSRLLRHLGKSGLQVTIQGRPKHIYSILRKMRNGVKLDEIYDLMALRVICRTKQNCYEVMGEVHSLWPAIPHRFKDWISVPKANGYQSIHTTVIVDNGRTLEIQIRTQDMHRVNEEGIAAHWKYKAENAENEKDLEERLVWLRRLIKWLTEIDDPDDFLDSLKESVAIESIFCFTPRGDVIEVHPGGTPLDFAFSVHTQIGLHCTGAKVNSRLVPLKTPLKNGDMVEIITSKHGHPSPDWLEIVKSGKARSKIRNWLKTEHYEEHVQEGKERLLRAVRERGQDKSPPVILKELEPLLPELGKKSVDDVLLELGFGNLSVKTIVDRLYPITPARRKHQRRPRKSNNGVLIEDLPNTEIRFAGCCHPVPGDDIAGYITIGRGVSVHKKSCNTLRTLLGRGEHTRLLVAKWDKSSLPRIAANLRILAHDRKGLLHDISDVMLANNLSIHSINTSKDKRVVTIRLQVEIQDRAQVNKIIPQLHNVTDVIRIDRVNFQQIDEDA